MPYKRVGKTIYTKSSGNWKKKQTCGSIKAAEKAMNLLRGMEHGNWRPTDKKKRGQHSA